MQMLTESGTDEYKTGVSKEVEKTLLKKYRPVDNIAGVEATCELEKLKFKKNRDPDKFFTQLAVLQEKYSNSKKFEASSLISTVIAKAPGEYSSLITSEKRRLGSSFNLEELQESMKSQYRIANYEKAEPKEKKTEVIM